MFRLHQYTTRNVVIKRLLSTTTTVNPQKIILSQPDLQHKSLFMLTTPSQLNNVVDTVINFHQTENANHGVVKQILVGCVDSIGGSRNGYSQLWLEEELRITDFETIEDRDKRIAKKVDPLSVDPIKLDKTWKDNTDDTSINMTLSGDDAAPVSFSVKLANTLFVNGQNSTCFLVDEKEHKFNWHNLANIEVDLSMKDATIKEENIRYFNKLTEIPLVLDKASEDFSEDYCVTAFEGNLIKSINEQSASGYLTNNDVVMESKKELFFKLSDDADTPQPNLQDEYYKLIVGGLGWGEKQAFLAIDPVVGTAGFRHVRLFYYDKSKQNYRYTSPPGATSNKLVFECSEPEESYMNHSITSDSREITFPNVFSVGSEKGYQTNKVWHKSPGEVIEFTAASP